MKPTNLERHGNKPRAEVTEQIKKEIEARLGTEKAILGQLFTEKEEEVRAELRC